MGVDARGVMVGGSGDAVVVGEAVGVDSGGTVVGGCVPSVVPEGVAHAPRQMIARGQRIVKQRNSFLLIGLRFPTQLTHRPRG